MTDKETLTKIITSHTVSWDQASLVADSILDAGWASPTEVRRASEYGYDEGLDFAIESIEESRKIQEDLRGHDPRLEDLAHAREGIDASSALTYGQYDGWLGEATLGAVKKELEQQDHNPFRTKKA